MFRYLLLLMLLLSPEMFAHKLAPSLLRIQEQSPEVFSVYWKTPIATESNARLAPEMPSSCEALSDPVVVVEQTARIWQWQLRCPQLLGQSISITGLAQSATATLVKINWLDGAKVEQLLNASTSSFVIPAQQSSLQVMLDYVALGGTHISAGLDHLLFVLALILLVRSGKKLLWTITAFTLGHSITLSLVVLGFVSINQDWVELLIALSIFVLALELSQNLGAPDKPSLWLSKHSAFIAIAFGLLHGMGFASALKELGLPASDIPLALFSFNVGIELGQIVFIGAVLLLMTLARLYLQKTQAMGRWGSVYAIGGLSAFWSLERVIVVFG